MIYEYAFQDCYLEPVELVLDDSPTAEELVAEKQKYDWLWDEIGNLTERKRDIICSLLGGATLERVGHRYELSKERVRQLQNKIIREIREE